MKVVGVILLFLLTAAQFVGAQTKVTIFLAGDSTCANKTSERRPETGWGEKIQERFDPTKVAVDNRAQNGRSTRTFIEQGHWKLILDSLKPGDWVFIQFGHNDSAKDRPDRYTPPEEFKRNLTRFVDEVRGKKAQVVLMTPVVRRRFDAAGKFVDVHGEYPDLTRAVAAERNVTLIDMHRKTMGVVQGLGVERSKELFLILKPGDSANFPNGVEDNTHFNSTGAAMVAGFAVDGIRERKIELRKFLKRK